MTEKIVATSVALVLDPDFGERIVSIASQMPCWIRESALNSPVAARQNEAGANVTVLLEVAAESDQQRGVRAIENVLDHHGRRSSAPCKEVHVFGLSSAAIPAALLGEHHLRVAQSADRVVLILEEESGT